MDWYLVRDREREGWMNMAIDAVMVENPPALPVLRFYSWNPPAVSLGLNQTNEALNRSEFQKRGLDLVRRPTGGRAVYHGNEITYSVIIPEKNLLYSHTTHELYCMISKALAFGLKHAGIDAEIMRNKSGDAVRAKSNLECFSSTARYEIKYNGRKLVGSAQRRMASAVLQHGSVLLENSQEILKNLFNGKKQPNGSKRYKDDNINSDIVSANLDRHTIIDSIVRGFENELNCVFADFDDYDMYIENIRSLKKVFSIYSALENSVPAEIRE
ncbi:biotin/lipoate A/B protein ligase family protein [candidate division KSB1 bacterium]